MNKPVLFVTGLGKSITRAENLCALFNAYPGDKEFITTRDWNWQETASSGKFDTMIIDVFPHFHPCKNVIMMWHAIQGGKYIGLDEKKYYPAEWKENMDYIIAAGHGGIEMFNRCTGVYKHQILNLGMPRTDLYIGKKKGDGHTVLAEKRAYLYVPTFRHYDETPLPCIDWGYIDSKLTDDELLVVKPHPYGSETGIGSRKHIIEVDRMQPSVNYLYDCDVLITDYSSIMFDAYLLNKPVILFEKNPGYCDTRGMYLKYPEQYCSRYAINEEQLVEIMKYSADKLTYVEKECIDYVADSCDGHSCRRIVQFLNDLNGGVNE